MKPAPTTSKQSAANSSPRQDTASYRAGRVATVPTTAKTPLDPARHAPSQHNQQTRSDNEKSVSPSHVTGIEPSLKAHRVQSVSVGKPQPPRDGARRDVRRLGHDTTHAPRPAQRHAQHQQQAALQAPFALQCRKEGGKEAEVRHR